MNVPLWLTWLSGAWVVIFVAWLAVFILWLRHSRRQRARLEAWASRLHMLEVKPEILNNGY